MIGVAMIWEKDLKIKQVDELISYIKFQEQVQMPKSGWINLIRTALGMSMRALGERIGLVQSRVAVIEQGERDKTITLHTLEKVAQGLNCELIYFLVPKSGSLANFREKQAYEKAVKLNTYAEQQMKLEDQATSKQFQAENINKLKDEFLRNWPRDFWDIK
jgi:predicted DNA-binding mobile mystery protein A